MNSPSEETRDDLIIVARAVRTRGLKGELLAEVLTDFPERFEQVSRLTGVSTSGERKHFELENHWFQNDRMVLKFAGYDSIESAAMLVGYEFGLPLTERVELAKDEFYDWELEGCEVRTATQPLGKVKSVLRTGGVELLVVANTDETRDYLLPLADSIVLEINPKEKYIVVDPPEGLLDL